MPTPTTIRSRSPSLVHRWALGRPKRTLAVAAAVVLLAVPGLFRLELDASGSALLPDDAPAIAYDAEIRRAFDIEDKVILVVESRHPDGIFNRATLRRIRDLSGQLADLPGIGPEDVVSLATEESGRRDLTAAKKFPALLDRLPESDEQMAALRGDVADLRILAGTLVSLDGGAAGAPTWRPSAAAILVNVDAATDFRRTHRQIRRLVERHGSDVDEDDGGDTVRMVGAPVAELLLGRHILADLLTLVPLAVALMGLVFLLRYRSLAAVWLPLLEVAGALVFVFGILGYAGIPVSITMTVLPVILTAIGVADEIHIFNRYVQGLESSPAAVPHLEVLAATLEEMWRPVVKTSVTSSFGFLSFLLSPIAVVRAFGLFVALAILFCMLWSLLVLPACLCLLRPDSFRGRSSSRALSRSFAALAPWVLAHRRAVLGGGGVLAVLVLIGLSRVYVQDSWVEGFAADSPFRRDNDRVNELFHGSHVLQVVFDTRPGSLRGEARADTSRGLPETAALPRYLRLGLSEPPALAPQHWRGQQVVLRVESRHDDDDDDGFRKTTFDRPFHGILLAEVVDVREAQGELAADLELIDDPRVRAVARSFKHWQFRSDGERLLSPQTLDRLRRFESHLASAAAGYGGILSATDQVAVTRYMFYGRTESARHCGETAAENRDLLHLFQAVRGEERLEEVFDRGRERALETVFLKNANFVATSKLMADLQEYERRHLAPHGIRIGFAGDVAVSQTMIGAIVSTQTTSLALALLGVFLVSSGFGRRPWLGLLCTLPATAGVLFNFAVMGLLGIPLGVATCMFASIAVGIGVDQAVHLTQRYLHFAQEDDVVRRLGLTLGHTGPAVLVDTLAITVAFALLAVSAVPSTARLGLSVAVSVVTCFGVTLLLLPILIYRRQPSPQPVLRAWWRRPHDSREPSSIVAAATGGADEP